MTFEAAPRTDPLLPEIELVFDPDCPNVDLARDALRRALAAAGQAQGWRERVQGAEGSGSRHFSPSILIDGRDPFGSETGDAAGCRLYENGSPPVAELVTALEAASRCRALGRRA